MCEMNDNPLKNALIDDLVNQLGFARTLAVRVGLDEHYISDIDHLKSVALANKVK